LRLAPSRACIDMPATTVEKKSASAAASAPGGTSPSLIPWRMRALMFSRAALRLAASARCSTSEALAEVAAAIAIMQPRGWSPPVSSWAM
jgi:hypothetical protein